VNQVLTVQAKLLLEKLY